MPRLNIENATDAIAAQFEVDRARFLERYENSGATPATAILVQDGAEDDCNPRVKREIDHEINENFDIRFTPRHTARFNPTTAAPAHSFFNDARRYGPYDNTQSVLRNRPLREDKIINSYFLRGFNFRVTPGDLLEIERRTGLPYNCRFLRVTAIYQDMDGIVIFRGMPYTRTRNTLGMLEYQRNEIVEVWDMDDDDDRGEEQAKVEIDEDAILGKRKFQITNTQWPKHACDYRDFGGDRRRADAEGPLTCRWRMVTEYRDRKYRERGQPFARTLYHLAEKDVDAIEGIKDNDEQPYRIPDITKLNLWRGTKTRGGSHDPESPGRLHGAIDLEEDNKQPLAIREGQKYTFGDIFCGAGGVSRGAQDAGVEVSFACDNDPPSCQTYRMNFPRAFLLEQNISEVVTNMSTKDMRLDLLHLSPPCQFWSPAHTIAGRNDEANTAILMSAREIIHKFRPRFATVEQTYGILRSQHMQHFHMLLNCFTAHGYSITWKFVKLNDFGVPQPRKRVIMIASCPGEVHPPMPTSEGIRIPSVNETLARISIDATHHDWRTLLRKPPFPKRRWDGNGILRNTITTTTNSNYNYHPSGLRAFTTRELAALQTFPNDFRFVLGQSQAKKQIGNAFPPLAVKYLYDHILRHMRDVDNVIIPGEAADEREGGMVESNYNDEDVVFVGSTPKRRRLNSSGSLLVW
ncbi:putative BAH domain-containing protein [Seiridium cardinale]|uniref:DNA (cytosine-5-)-methyltransferase n=1 Tax=Seiridium cardinale TaxID=138064 RepID=A0ABR2XRD6_9PEZI